MKDIHCISISNQHYKRIVNRVSGILKEFSYRYVARKKGHTITPATALLQSRILRSVF